MLFFFLLLFVVLLIQSDTRKEGSSVLVKVDLLMYKFPDSALCLLRNFNPDAERLSIKANYALLLTQANDKNYILHTSDSIINIAVRYYDSIQAGEQAAKSHYYLGRVYQDMRDDLKAVREFLVALFLAKESDKSLLCLLYGNLGQIYFQQNLLDKADSLFILSENIAVQKCDSFNLAMGLVARGNICLHKEKYLLSMKFFEQALFIAKKINNSNAQKIVCNSMAVLYALVDCPDKTIKYSREGLESREDLMNSAKLYLLEGNALLNFEQNDSAVILISKGLNSSNLYTKATAYSLLADIKEKQGKLREALAFRNCYIECLDSLKLIEQKTQKVIFEGNKLIFLKPYKRVLNNYQYYIYGLFVCILVLIVCWMNNRYCYSNKIKDLVYKKNSLEKQVGILYVMQEELKKQEQELEYLQEFVGTVEEDKARLYLLTNQIVLQKRENKEFF